MLLDCLTRAFHALGIPAEILVDNMKQAVDQHDVTTGTVRWNAGFLDFAEHYGFLPVACPPYWPRVKGKVERGVGYIKASFLEGRSFTSLDDLNQQLAIWLDTVANVRIHGTTGVRPVDRHAHERLKLRVAAALPHYDTRALEIRQVSSDCHFSYDGVLYSVPPEAAGKTVVIRFSTENVGSRLAIYLGEQLIATHERRPKGSDRVTLAEHAIAIRRLTRSNGQGARKCRGRQPKFEQTTAPSVEERSLAVYDELAMESAA